MRHGIALTLLVLLALLASCSSEETPLEGNYHVGTQGITMRFMPGNPPPKVYTGSSMNVVLELHNQGAWPPYDSSLGLAHLFLTGYDPMVLTLGPQDPSTYSINSQNNGYTVPISTVNLYGKSVYTPEGGIVRVGFYDNDVQFGGSARDIYDATIQATLCYTYKTIAEPVICFDQDPYNVNIKDKVCTIPQSGYSMGGGQGAPVAVTRIEQSVLKDRMQFKVWIQNVGGGTVIDDEVYYQCPNEIDYSDMDVVYVNGADSGLGKETLICDPTRITLYNGQGSTICTVPFAGYASASSAFETTLRLVFEYAYRDTISTRTSIVRVPNDQ